MCKGAGIVFSEHSSCTHSIGGIHIYQVTLLCQLQNLLTVSTNKTRSTQTACTQLENFVLWHRPTSVPAIRHVKLTIEVSTVDSVEAKPVEIDETSCPDMPIQLRSVHRPEA